MSKRKRPSQRVGVSGQHPPFPRRAELWMALGLTALAPGAALAAFPANINLSALDGTNGFKLSGVAAGDYSGSAVSTAGDEGARAGSAGGAARAGERAVDAERDGDRGLHLRRRHAAGCAPRHSRARARGAQQPRHDAFGHPAAPSALGEAVREPAVRRHRRAARLSRRVRQPPDERAAAAPPHLPALRVESGLHLLVGDDRQPARAGGGARRAAVRARLRERRAAWREVLPVRQPAGRQPAARHPPVVSRRDAPRRLRVPEAPAAGHRLRAEPAHDRNPDDLPEGRFRRSAGDAGADPRLSRRLPAAAPARDRKRPARGQRAGGRLDQRARARHRHRRARRLRDGRLPGNDCRHVAARRTRRAAHGRSAAVLVAAARRSISSSCATRRISSTRRPSTRSSTRTTCTSWSIT